MTDPAKISGRIYMTTEDGMGAIVVQGLSEGFTVESEWGHPWLAEYETDNVFYQSHGETAQEAMDNLVADIEAGSKRSLDDAGRMKR